MQWSLTNLNLNLNNPIVTSLDCQHKQTFMWARRTDSDQEMSWWQVTKEVCSLSLVHVTCKPTRNTRQRRGVGEKQGQLSTVQNALPVISCKVVKIKGLWTVAIFVGNSKHCPTQKWLPSWWSVGNCSYYLILKKGVPLLSPYANPLHAVCILSPDCMLYCTQTIKMQVAVWWNALMFESQSP